MTVPLPKGLAAIVAAYGDPLAYVNDPGLWEQDALAYYTLGAAIPYAYDRTVRITRIRGHKDVVGSFGAALEECLRRGVAATRLAYGGCYVWRVKRGSTKLSTHTWGIAIDLDPGHNPMGARWADLNPRTRLHPTIVEVFQDAGFYWGDAFNDPMHWQACRGY